MWWVGVAADPPAVLGEVAAHLGRVFGLPARLRTDSTRPLDSWDPRRRQHSSGAILRFLVEHRPPAATKVLGITDVDLFIPVLTYVFGEAQLGGAAAVVSTARLTERANPRLLLARLAKESAHELGHTFGLLHCDADGCVMRRSPTLFDVDAKGTGLCPACRLRLGEPRPGGAT